MKFLTHKRKQSLFGICFVLPATILFAMFTLYPAIRTAIMSFFKWDMLGEMEYVGFKNYVDMFHDERLSKILSNTALLASVSVILKLSLGVLLAYFVYTMKSKIGAIIMESAIFLPIVLPMSVVSMVFMMLFSTDTGAINGFLHLLGIPKINWLSSEFMPLVSVLIIDIWKGVGFFFIVSLVAMREIPVAYLEAAELDGATSSQKFRKIILPCISATTLFLIINALITSIQMFDPVYMIMRNGGPGDAATTISYYIWNTGLYERNVGYGSALALVLCLTIMGLTLLQFILSRLWVNYEK